MNKRDRKEPDRSKPLRPAPVTVQDLIEALLKMPANAELCTYHMGNYPRVESLDCSLMGGVLDDNPIVELNLIWHED